MSGVLRRPRLVAACLALCLALCLASPASRAVERPALPALSVEEEAILARGEVLVRAGAAGQPTLVAVDVAADPDRTFAAVMDLEARVGEVSALKEATVYLDTPEVVGARFVVGIAGLTVTFHTRYQVDRAARWCSYALDPEQDNGLQAAAGSYQVVPTATGSRVIYLASASGEGEPGWLRKHLQEMGSRALLGGIKARAEAP
ncbi:hypothetical protein L6R53_20945 [Myxococcota bacterium]|nr:hypothetical protein [Myxococcota bacterium]